MVRHLFKQISDELTIVPYSSTLEQQHKCNAKIVNVVNGLSIGKNERRENVYVNTDALMPYVVTDCNHQDVRLYTNGALAINTDSQFLVRTAFECRFCYEGIVSLHAACVEMGDFAVAFTGHSGLGKSTRARAWVEGLGARWISGDRPAIRLEKQGSTACGVPWDGKEQIFRDVELPLRCIMEVRRSPVNYIRKLSEDQARQLIMQQSFVPMWDTDAAVMAMANVRALIRKTPVHRVFCEIGRAHV